MKKIIILIGLILTACGRTSGETSILDKSSCEFPCWNEIVPGQTTENQLLKVLENLPEINQKTIQSTGQARNIFDDQVFFSFRESWSLKQRPKLRGETYIINNKVSNIILCGTINTSMSQIVDKIGEPENIISGNNIGSGRTVILINSKSGVSYWFTANLNNLEITPTTAIDCVHMFDTSLYNELLDAKLFSAGYYDAEGTLKVMYPWDGYGNLDEKYPPRQP